MTKIVKVHKNTYVDRRRPTINVTPGAVVTAVAAGVALALLTRD